MEDVDLSDTIAPNSDQLNADDLMAGPRTYTITDVTKVKGEQPTRIHLAELPGRTYRPSKTQRRVLIAAWGSKGAVYIGRQMTLYRDPDVQYGGAAVGGIKISHLSHIGGRLNLSLTSTRGKKAPITIEPLPDVTTEPTAGFVQGDGVPSADQPTCGHQPGDTPADHCDRSLHHRKGNLPDSVPGRLPSCP